MEWSKEKCYVLFTEASEYLKSKLGISILDLDLGREVLLPYQTKIIQYINEKLVLLASDDLKSNVQEVLGIYSHGADLICDKKTIDLLCELQIPQDDVNFDEDRFVFAWTNFLTSLCLRLKLQYASLFIPKYDGECCKCGKPGEKTKDFNSWVSNVFPEDEEYDRTNYTRDNSSWQIGGDKFCNCYRHKSESGEE